MHIVWYHTLQWLKWSKRLPWTLEWWVTTSHMYYRYNLYVAWPLLTKPWLTISEGGNQARYYTYHLKEGNSVCHYTHNLRGGNQACSHCTSCNVSTIPPYTPTPTHPHCTSCSNLICCCPTECVQHGGGVGIEESHLICNIIRQVCTVTAWWGHTGLLLGWCGMWWESEVGGGGRRREERCRWAAS